ncbi:hypothetical protein OC842_000888 [Tilletia horrida]|uniref:Protection of telomeres protein 1 n=1 Tax=Tilletia horrida TaxID=155126 RepID=A0AAN6GG23_9BASI|nr:hypothetical protein OC842_000888 [Tilletia horrida]
MTRKKQAQARAVARARDGSVPLRRATSVTSSTRGLSVEHNTDEGTSVKQEPVESVGSKRSAADDDDDADRGTAPKRIKTDNVESNIAHTPVRPGSSAAAQGQGIERCRENSIQSEAPSWLNTPESSERRMQQTSAQVTAPTVPTAERAIAAVLPPRRPEASTSTNGSTSAQNEGQSNSKTANGYKQRGSTSSSAVAGPSNQAQASTSNNTSSNGLNRSMRKGKGKMKPLSLAGTVYTPIPQLTQGRSSNFIGVVVSYRVPTKAIYGTGDYSMNMNTVDYWCYNSNNRVSVNFFARAAQDLPSHVAEGMVILLRQVRMTLFNGKITGTVYKERLAWATLSLDGKYKQLTGIVVHPQEREHMREMSKWYAETYLGQSSNAQGSANGAAAPEVEVVPGLITQNLKRTVTLDQIQDGVFCHCIAEVVRLFGHGERPEIYITDWTNNPQLLAINNKDLGWTQEDLDRLEQARGDKGGGSVLKITLWDEQINAVTALRPGQMVHIRNLRCKRSPVQMLEGTIGGSRTLREFKDNKWQIQKLKKTDPLLDALLKRKKKMAEDLELERALEWPDSGESASRVKEEAKSPASGASGNAQNPESLNSLVSTDVSTKAAESAGNAQSKNGSSTSAAMVETRPARTGTAEQQSVPPADGISHGKVLQLTASAAQMSASPEEDRPVAPSAHDGTQENTGEAVSQDEVSLQPRVDKGKGHEMPSSFPFSDSTHSQSTQQSSASPPKRFTPALPSLDNTPSDETSPVVDKKMAVPPSTAEPSNASIMSNSGTPSVMYSMPPPGQGPPPAQPPASSHPSASQLEVHAPAVQPVTSTPLAKVAIAEERDSDLDSSSDDDNDGEEDDRQRQQRSFELAQRRAQERADEIVSCRVASQKVAKMREIAEGKGIGVKHHVRGRIVDTIPRDISRWVKVRCSSCQRTLPDTDNFCAPCADEEGLHLKYEWMFALILQDEDSDAPASSVPVIVTADEANGFLSGFDPAKHRRNAKSQRKLRERLNSIFGPAIEDADQAGAQRRRSNSASTSSAEGSSKDGQAGADKRKLLLLNPVIDLGVYAFRMPSKSKTPHAQGDIKCKLFGTELRLKSSQRL